MIWLRLQGDIEWFESLRSKRGLQAFLDERSNFLKPGLVKIVLHRDIDINRGASADVVDNIECVSSLQDELVHEIVVCKK